MDSQSDDLPREAFTWRQIGYTVLPGLISVFALTGAVHSAAVLTHNTNRLYKLSKVEEWPEPCGMALPSLSRLAIELGGFPIVGNPLPTSKDLFVKAKDALCSSSSPEEFSVHFYANAEYTEVTNGSEYQVKDAICNAGYHRRVDLLTRVSRAYLNAQPAFYAYNENTTKGLCGFRYGCEKWETILAHMGQAKTLDVTYGVVGSMPHVNTMLYRLVALSVLGQDQPSCFQPETVNTTMCMAVYKDATPPEGTKFALTEGESVYDGYYHDSNIPSGRCSTEPDKPPEHDAVSFMDSDNDHAAIQHCQRIHKYALFDRVGLFGIPDIHNHPDLESNEIYISALSFVYRSMVSWWFYENRKGLVLQDHNRELVLYYGTRVAISSYYAVISMCVFSYFLFFALHPMVALMLYLISPKGFGYEKETPGTLLRPRAGLMMAIMTIVTILLWLWITILDPLPPDGVLRVNGDCTGFDTDSGVHIMTNFLYDQGTTTLWLILVTEVLIILWFASTVAFSALSKPPAKKKRAYRNYTLFIITILALVVIFEAIGMSGGFEILRNALVHDSRPYPWLSEKTLTIERDSVVLAATVICWTFLATSISRFGLFSAGSFATRAVWLVCCMIALLLPRTVKTFAFGGDYAVTYNEGGRYTANVFAGVAEGLALIFLFIVVSQIDVSFERIGKLFGRSDEKKKNSNTEEAQQTKAPLITPPLQKLPMAPPQTLKRQGGSSSLVSSDSKEEV
jgi:hypothetical protein